MIKKVLNWKTWALFLALVTGFTLTGCFKGNDKDNEDENGVGNGRGGGNIVGVWKYYETKIVDIKWAISLSNSEKKEVENVILKVFDNFFPLMECTASGKMDFGEGYYVDTYIVNGEKITIHEHTNTYTGTYSVTGDKLQLNLDFAQFDPDLGELFDTLVLGLIFIRIGDSTRSAHILNDPSDIKQETGFLQKFGLNMSGILFQMTTGDRNKE